MAEIVFGAGTSHSPLLTAPPSMWAERGEQDRKSTELYDLDGVCRDYQSIEAARGDRYLGDLRPEVWEDRWKSCQTALDRLRDDLALAEPDVLLVIGDDQRELFDETNQPAISISGAGVMSTGVLDHHDSAFFKEAARGYLMDEEFEFTGHPELAEALVRGLNEVGFDVGWMADAPRGRGFGHAYGFPIYRLFADGAIPVVPLMLNTYYPPNQPTPKRCFDLGVALRGAVATADCEARVAVLASGGLSHFVVNEELDQQVLTAMVNADWDALCAIPPALLNSGSSEIRNWIAVAGAMRDSAVKWHEYVPVYRSPAGTGCGMGFLVWS